MSKCDVNIFQYLCFRHDLCNVRAKDMASRAMFLYPDLDKSSVRALKAEERLLELKVHSIDVSKKTVVVDLKKSQTEMKRRLRKYRDRQRDLSNAVKPITDNVDQSIEEFMASNIKNKTFTRNSLQRPKTCPDTARSRSSFSRASLGTTHTTDNEAIEIDPSFFTDQQRSKIDLRPSTGKQFRGNKDAVRKFARIQGLGDVNEQVRYFDKDELQDRVTFYEQLLKWRRNKELGKYESLDTKVAEFCDEKNEDLKRRLLRNSCLRQSSQSVMGFHKQYVQQEIKRKYSTNRPASTVMFLDDKDKEDDIIEDS